MPDVFEVISNHLAQKSSWYINIMEFLEKSNLRGKRTKFTQTLFFPIFHDFVEFTGGSGNQIFPYLGDDHAKFFSRILFEYHSVYRQLQGHALLFGENDARIGRPFEYNIDFDEFALFLSRNASRTEGANFSLNGY